MVTAAPGSMTCGEALMHLLWDYGVDVVFGIPGEHTLELYRGIASSKVRHVLTRHEQGAGFMADGYGRVTGQPGVCTLITGPGVTNCAFNDLYPATVAVQGDAGPSVDAIVRILDRRPVESARGTTESLVAVRTRQEADLTAVERQHRKLLLKLRTLLPPDTTMFGDIAQLVYTGSAFMPTDLPRTWFYPAGLGTLGCALPGAIGAKVALPDRPVVVLVGDGGFLFTIQELATAVEEALAIPIILWNNDSLAMIRDGMIKRGISRIGVNPKNPDFMKIAEGFGCHGIRPDSMASFVAAVDEALLASVPTIIEVREDAGWLL